MANQSPEFGGTILRPHSTIDPTAGSPAFGAKRTQMVDISSPEDDFKGKKQRDVTSTLDQHVVSQIYKTLDFQSQQKQPPKEIDDSHEAFKCYIKEKQKQGNSISYYQFLSLAELRAQE